MRKRIAKLIMGLTLIIVGVVGAYGSEPYYSEAEGEAFRPGYRTHDGKSGSVSCSNGPRECKEARAERIVQGVKVTRDCWQYGYDKEYEVYPSKNDCARWKKCYAVADRECLTFDSYGNCVNIKKEFSCKARDLWTEVDKEKARWDGKDSTRARELVCKGIPCIDGNCVDKSYEMNGEMPENVAKLYAVSQAKEKGAGAAIFPGKATRCTKKAIGYSNCCKVGTKELFNNWGHHMGARCSADEKQLLKNRRENLCIYVGKKNKGGMIESVEHHYCCFGNLLNKVIQIQARNQLGMGFGSRNKPDCRGLTLDEVMRLRFDEMDLSEAYADLIKKLRLPDFGDVDDRIKGALPKIKQWDGNERNRENSKSGINMEAAGVMSDESGY